MAFTTLAVKDGAGSPQTLLTAKPNGTDQASAHFAVATPEAAGCSIFRSLSLLATGINVKNAAGQLYGGFVTNNAVSARFLKLYNLATAPTVGTDTPVMTLELPAGWAGPLNLPDSGLVFNVGIGVGATNLVADADTTAPSANDVVVNLFYI